MRSQLVEVARVQKQQVAEQREANVQSALGLQVEFESFEGVELAAKSLAQDPQGIELLNVRQRDEKVLATVFVPEGKLVYFERVLADYESRRVDRTGRPRDYRPLIDSIAAVRVATFESLWTDAIEVLPPDNDTPIWWEVWLPAGRDRLRTVADFQRIARLAGLIAREEALAFPERSVILIYGPKRLLLQSSLLLNAIAELRRAKDTTEFFDALTPPEQADWVTDLQGRIEPPAGRPASACHITLLDTGVNYGHPLLAPYLDARDVHTVEPEWTAADDDGHGTQLAGLSLFGDLIIALQATTPIRVDHRLESVKLLRRSGTNQGLSFGNLTVEAVSRVEITAPHRARVFSMAITAPDGRDRGRPSSWSATIDRLASDADGAGSMPRLFIVSAGNTVDHDAWNTYPDSLATNSVHDPAQAWNAITVGAYTQLSMITEADATDYTAIAPVDGLSPFTTTSVTWPDDWPFKPDIVMEGGNAAQDSMRFACSMSSLSLLTTHARPTERLFDLSRATSGASALAARMAVQIRIQYPHFWSETVRALMVHSARWTPRMYVDYQVGTGRKAMRNLLRHCGYGVPNLEQALWSAGNSLTLIVQDMLQPYHKTPKGVKARDMHLHDLPWPVEVLQELGDTPVTLRITLSYFVEPNPGERGGIDKYAYQSHALRFAVRRPLESERQFRHRLNAQAAQIEQGTPTSTVPDPGWVIGESLRRRGSLASDAWNGTASELANRGQIAVFPAMGWWRDRPALDRFERPARYALVVSIEAPEVSQDLYAIVQSQIVLNQAVITPAI